MHEIESIYLDEPRRDGEYPEGARVGYDGVTRIKERTDNYGDHGLLWFDVYKGSALVKSFGGRHVATVSYLVSEEIDHG